MTTRSTIVRKKPTQRNPERIGVAYLFHFSAPIGNPASRRGQAQHYLGWTDDLQRRLPEHRNGWGAAITRHAVEQGITLHLVRIWVGTRSIERDLKRCKNLPRLCPTCRQQHPGQQLVLPLDFGDLELQLLQQVPRKPDRVSWEEIQHYRSRAVTSTVIDYDAYAEQYADCDIPL